MLFSSAKKKSVRKLDLLWSRGQAILDRRPEETQGRGLQTKGKINAVAVRELGPMWPEKTAKG